jgi:hypothetical protein
MKKVLNWFNRTRILKAQIARLNIIVAEKDLVIVQAATQLVKVKNDLIKLKLQVELKKDL